MAGKREKKEKRLPLPGVLLVLAVLAAVLSTGGPHGAAVNSPVETLEPEVTPVVETAEESVASEAEPEGMETVWEGPVPESPLVQDTYFDDVVFLGDSRTDGLRLYSGIKNGIFLCSTGATVESVFNKSVETVVGEMPLLDALALLDCGKIYIMLGINELGWNGTETFRTQSAALIRRIQADHPEAEIVIQSILPVSAEKDDEGRYVNNGRIDQYNQVWMDLAEELDAAYLNVAEGVAGEDGQLPSDLCYDGVHLNKAGCRLWLDYLRTHAVGDIQDVIAPAAVETEAPAEPVLPSAEG